MPESGLIDIADRPWPGDRIKKPVHIVYMYKAKQKQKQEYLSLAPRQLQDLITVLLIAHDIPLSDTIILLVDGILQPEALFELILASERTQFVQVRFVIGAIVGVPGLLHGEVVPIWVGVILDDREPVCQDPAVAKVPFAEKAAVAA